MSKIAGKTAVMQTAVTRCVLVPAACLLIPPIGMAGVTRIPMFAANAQLRLFAEIGIIFASLQAILPAALAVFPQVGFSLCLFVCFAVFISFFSFFFLLSTDDPI
jgi:hypothetical protein